MDCDGRADLHIVFKDHGGHTLMVIHWEVVCFSNLIQRSDSIIRHFVLVLPLDARLLEPVIIATLVSHYRTIKGVRFQFECRYQPHGSTNNIWKGG